jgi:hypothetical protein
MSFYLRASATNSGVCMRTRHAITVGILALGAVAGSGLAAYADSAVPGTNPANALRGGLDEYQIVASTPSTTSPVTVTCPLNKQRVTGGGARITGAVVATTVLTGTYPTVDGRGWTAEAILPPGATLQAWAVCAEVDD